MFPLAIAVALVLGAAAWWFLARGSAHVGRREPARDLAQAADGSAGTRASPADATPIASSRTTAPQVPITVDAAPRLIEDDPASAARLTGDTGSFPLAFDRLPAVPGTEAHAAAWERWVRTGFLEGSPAERELARDQLDTLDPVDAEPAFLNSLAGLDMARAAQVSAAAEVIASWHQRAGQPLRGRFPEAAREDRQDIDERMATVAAWVRDCAARLADPARLAAFREQVAARR
ncbi:MAG TPA: hypothetical protein VK824_06995 [Planctomycetota bacterium]|nr:hypothetical protein [Planctomycetota bacterium]